MNTTVIERVVLESRVRLAEATATGWETVANEQARQMRIMNQQLSDKQQEVEALQSCVTHLTTKLVVNTHCKCHAPPEDLKDALIALQAAEIQILRELMIQPTQNVPT